MVAAQQATQQGADAAQQAAGCAVLTQQAVHHVLNTAGAVARCGESTDQSVERIDQR